MTVGADQRFNNGQTLELNENSNSNMKTKHQTLKSLIAATLCAGSLALLAGCGGGGATLESTGNTTLGQQLIDLQQSYEKGIITKKEYDDCKKELIKKYTSN